MGGFGGSGGVKLPPLVDPSFEGLEVAGIDLEQPMSAVLLCEETVDVIYGHDFSPTRLKYTPGARPMLESIVAGFKGRTTRERVDEALDWVITHVRHPHIAGDTPKNRALTEEELIDSGIGWCNEQSRVFIALCEVMEIPGRISFLSHKNKICGHATTEIYIDGKWSFYDVTFGARVAIPDGSLGSVWELSRTYRDLAHEAYRRPLEDYISQILPFVEGEAGWKSSERVKPDAGGDLLHGLGICNYIIDGARAVDSPGSL